MFSPEGAQEAGMMTNAGSSRTVAICDSQPVAIEGLRSLLKPCEDLRIVGAVTSFLRGMDRVRTHPPAIVLIDKSFGLQAVMDWLTTIRAQWTGTAPIVWGMSMNEAEALRLV